MLLLLGCQESTADMTCHPFVDEGCDFDEDGVNNESDPFPDNALVSNCEEGGFECGTAANGVECGECAGEFEYCDENKCIDDCKEYECGISDRLQLNCGECDTLSVCNNHLCEQVAYEDNESGLTWQIDASTIRKTVTVQPAIPTQKSEVV
jgi:hypothetical protein